MYKPNNIDNYLEKYIQFLMLKNRSEYTIQGIKYDLGFFFRYLRKQGIVDLSKVTEGIIEGYKKYIYKYRKRDKEPLSVTTIRYRLFAVKKFYEYLNQRQGLYVNPVKDLEIPEQEDTIPRIIMSRKEIKKMLKMPDWRTQIGYRDRAIMEVLYSTAIRNAELRHLKIEDINLEKGLLRVNKGKGGKMRVVPIGTVAIRFVEGYIERIRPQFLSKNSNEKTLFLCESGIPLYSTALNRIIRKYRLKAWISKRITAHTFRHTAATHLLEENMDIRYIQEFLGHSKLETTEKYTRVVIKDLQEKYSKYHSEKEEIDSIEYTGTNMIFGARSKKNEKF